MAEHSAIEWTDHTFNPWIGCQRVSPACDHCYAEAWDNRYGGGHWGAHAPRRLTSDANWRKPLKWNRDAKKAGKRARVFCCSLADVFDNQAPAGAHDRLWQLIRETPFLEWQLLTKRVGNIPNMLPADWGDGYPNVGLMITVVTQEEADRDVPKLLAIQAKWRGLSIEPLLEPIELWRFDEDQGALRGCGVVLSGGVSASTHDDPPKGYDDSYPGLDWVIVGGESGPGARPMHPDWARSIRDQCQAAGVPFFFKQWGEWAPHRPVAGGDLGGDVRAGRVMIVHPNGMSHVEVSKNSGGRNTLPGSLYMAHVGKKLAGRLLDGRTWDQMPAEPSD